MNAFYVVFLLVSPYFSGAYSLNEGNTTDVEEVKKIVQKEVEEIKRACDNQYKQLEQRLLIHESKRAIAGGIAFSTQLTTKLRNLKLGTIIKYDRVILNDASSYDIRTGVFTAPESGVYMFSYFLGHGNEPAQVWLQLMHNGNKINSGVSDTFHNAEDLQGGNIAIFRMSAGDRVWLETFHQDNAYIEGPYGFTTFSGVYLYG